MICDDARAGLLAGTPDPRYDAHLSACADCRAARPELDRIRRSLADAAMWEGPSASADDLMARLGFAGRPSPQGSHIRRWSVGIAAAVIAVIGVAALLVVGGDSSDWTVPLAGAESAPGASGSVAGWNVDGGTRLVLETSGLAPAPPGETYELWFMSADEVFSAGTFADPGKVQLMVGVSRREYPNVLVTLEPADGDPAPSATWVLWSTWDEEEQ